MRYNIKKGVITVSYSGSVSVGIDIGTTSISAAVIDFIKRTVVDTYTIPYAFGIACDDPGIREQDARKICDSVLGLAEEITNKFDNVKSIGVTGQMHGIVYLDKSGNAASNLKTWQDKRGDKLYESGETYCQRINSVTGESIYTGYGFSTIYYDLLNGLIPSEAHSFCSIMDYAVMKLTGNDRPMIHTSVANSFGLFDVLGGTFKHGLIEKLGIVDISLPAVTDDYAICGSYKNVPVSVAIGDNQASFLGTVDDVDSSILLNVGTGSQISSVTSSSEVKNGLEIRPLVKGRYLQCGSALCGGSAYALLERFFREYVSATGADAVSQYEIINKLAKEAYVQGKETPFINTSFMGKRSDPDCTGFITGITYNNFTPGNIALGFIKGICFELYQYFKDELSGKNAVIASGNAVQRIDIFKDIIAEMFGLPVMISSTTEEASVGAALFSLVSVGVFDDIKDFGNFIKYN